MHTCIGVISLASQRHGGMAPLTGALEWKGLDLLGKTGSGDKGEAKLLCQQPTGVHETLPGEGGRPNQELVD